MTDEYLPTTPATKVTMDDEGGLTFTEPPELDPESSAIADVIADRIVAKLGQSVIPSSIPAAIGEWIKKTSEHRSWEWTHVIPMQPPGSGLAMWFRFNPDGTINMEMKDTTGWIFWRGTFVPVEEQ